MAKYVLHLILNVNHNTLLMAIVQFNTINALRSFIQEHKFYFALALFFIIIIILFIIPVVMYHISKFEKVITIRNKYTRYRRRGSNYNIVDTDGHIYQVDNLWFKGDFNRSNDYVALTIGNTYKVKGYGYRIGLLNAYQKIYAFEEV
jgi:hypothetical protein